MDQKEFDGIIKANLIKIGKKHDGKEYTENDFCYRDGEYENYFSKAVFEEFMKVEKDNLPKYSGGELSEKGKLPPKMASVGSSSRFCYLALKDWAKAYHIEFEKECKIAGIDGGAPQLDAFISKKNVYVEAKCHEIFTRHKVSMSTAYQEHLENGFGLEPVLEKPNSDNETVESLKINLTQFGFEENRKRGTRFDIKQFLCHLMGIASQKHNKATLMYMFFRPLCDDKSVQKRIDEVFGELKSEIETIFNNKCITDFCKQNGIDLCAIVESAKVMETLTDTPPKNYDKIAEFKYSNN